MAAIVTLTMMVTVASCSKNTCPNPGCRTPEEALADYSSFLKSLSSMKDVSTKQLISYVKEWKSIDDSVASSLNRVASYNDNDSLPTRYIAMRDSTCDIILGMIDTQKRSFKDYLQCARELNYTRLDSASFKTVVSFREFFNKIDELPVYNSTDKETVHYYEFLLNETLRQGIESPKGLFKYLKEEDRAFRTFLCHLPTLGKIPHENVRDSTKKVLSNIISLTQEENFAMSPKEILILLTMRNTRRLTQNANQCLSDIADNINSAGDQTTAYLWMILQPWVSFDSFAFALMDENQWEEMEKLAEQMPKTLNAIKEAEFPIEPSLLPNILIKTLITQLI